MMTMMLIHSQTVVIVSLANTKNQGGDAIGRLANHSSLRLAVQACPTIPPHGTAVIFPDTLQFGEAQLL